MFGDLAISFEGGDVFPNLTLNEFDTYRFETPDGSRYCFYVNGQLFYCRDGLDFGVELHSLLQIRGEGGCDLDLLPTINRWDFIRYGQIAEGESIVSSDPPAGVIDILDLPNLDRFIVSFDAPNYVLVDDITVTSTGGTTPSVAMIRRLNNSEPNIVEIVLDRKLRVGETTTFTFAKVAAPNTVSYSYLAFGACCLQDGTCADTEKNECLDQGGVFSQGGQCADTQACCFGDGSCAELFQRCCRAQGGTPVDTEALCEGDADFDGLDGSCGDGCPTDTGKTEPGVCGCGVTERDRDDDTIPDCIDQCPNQDDRIDENDDGLPDCLDFLPIPTTTAWGLAILTLLLLTAGKIFHRRFCPG